MMEVLVGLTFTTFILFVLLLVFLILAKGPALTFMAAKLLKRPLLAILRPDKSVDFRTAKREGDSYIVKPYGRFIATPESTYTNPYVGVVGFALSTKRSLVNLRAAKFLEKSRGKPKMGDVEVAGETIEVHEVEKYLGEVGSPSSIENLVKLVEAKTAMEYLRSLPKGGGFNWTLLLVVLIIMLVAAMLLGGGFISY